METKPKTSLLLKLGGSVAGLLVLLVILVAANVIFSQMRIRKDLTSEKLYTLSEGSHKVLGKLDRDVTLMLFFNSSSPEVPAPLKSFAQQVEDLLKEYELAGGGRVVVEKYDPKPDSDAEDLAQRYGLQGQALPQSGTMLYLGLVAVSGDRQMAIPMIDPRTEDLLEYSVTRMIHRVTTLKRPVLGVLTSLPVMGSTPPSFAMPGQPRPQPEPTWAAFRDLSQDYAVRTVAPTTDRIDSDVDALVVLHPKNLSDATLFALDQFVLRGGRLLAFVDPFCVADSGGGEMSQFGMPSRSSNLDKLFTAWGVQYDPGKVVADLEAMTALRGRNNTVENSPLYLSLRKVNFARNDVLTSSLNSLMMVMSGSLGSQAAEGLTVTPLITTSVKSAPTEASMLQFDPNAFRRQFKSGQQRLNLAIRLQGKFKTAFPDGKPTPPAGETNAVSTATDSAPALKESQTDGNVILVADADLLYNEFCGQELDFLGYKAFQPFNDNLVLFANMVEQMAGSADLIGIRSRGRTQRPFTRVLALQAAAEEQWMEREQSLQQKLQATQRRMEELQGQKDDQQRFVLSPAQQKELAGFRQEVASYRQELKQVRRNLREGIEALGMRIKVINMLLVPALVALAGMVFFVIRRSKTRR